VDDDYVEQVLSIVERVPPGRVTTYGLIAEAVGRGGPRQVGAVMATYGGPVPWWRVVRADGSLPDSHLAEAHQEYLAEGTPMRSSGAVDIRAAVWLPEDLGTSSS
jgi:alkylated DNA nucleotide flippase Atl1